MFYKSKNWQSARTSIRRHAHLIFHSIVKHNSCFVCGYDKHIEIAHVKAVKDFSDNALLSEINNSNNLIGLCRNHHWEYDNNLLMFQRASA